ncbi:DUF6157 family protein [Paenibacillus jiagnxiensis]|uniref:DUF6157 family protein n=1 Tax=Paenibacillus jiagnxiensis TaxID=3228926 RepID=UPI0033A03A1A
MNLNYYNTFITVSSDCPVMEGTIPQERAGKPTKAGIEYELAARQPYFYTQEELLYQVYIRHKEIPEEELERQGAVIRGAFFGKSQACLRASMLPKKFGWGIHFNAEGKLAMVPMESEQYRSYVEGEHEEIKVIPAMRNARPK